MALLGPTRLFFAEKFLPTLFFYVINIKIPTYTLLLGPTGLLISEKKTPTYTFIRAPHLLGTPE